MCRWRRGRSVSLLVANSFHLLDVDALDFTPIFAATFSKTLSSSTTLTFGAGLWIFEHFKGIPATPAEGEGGEDEKAWARWRKWLKAVETRESVTNTMSDREHYLPIYERYHNDEAQSELAKATRQGRGVP